MPQGPRFGYRSRSTTRRSGYSRSTTRRSCHPSRSTTRRRALVSAPAEPPPAVPPPSASADSPPHAQAHPHPHRHRRHRHRRCRCCPPSPPPRLAAGSIPSKERRRSMTFTIKSQRVTISHAVAAAVFADHHHISTSLPTAHHCCRCGAADMPLATGSSHCSKVRGM